MDTRIISREDVQGSDAEKQEKEGKRARRSERVKKGLLFALFAVGEILVLVPANTPWRDLDQLWLRIVLAALVGLPCALSVLIGWRLGLASGRLGLKLHVHEGSPQRVAEAVQKTWEYERDRHRRALTRAELHAAGFGAVTSLFLVCSVLLARWKDFIDLQARPEGPDTVILLATSMAAATATVYLVHFAEVILRLSTLDYSAKTFSWASRAIVLVVIADVGLVLALPDLKNSSALLLGVLVGVTGEHAIQFLLDKAPKLFGLSAPSTKRSSPLLAVEGITEEHVHRLEEEGLLSLQDLALAPTARLFFNTPYGLATVTEWQDRALLSVRMGADRARDLSSQMGIHRATALRSLAQDLLQDRDRADKKMDEALRRALKLDKDLPLDALLKKIDEDEAVARLEVHERSVVEKPAQFEGVEEFHAKGDEDQFTCARQPLHVEQCIPYEPRPPTH